jgi:hypothetical protein
MAHSAERDLPQAQLLCAQIPLLLMSFGQQLSTCQQKSQSQTKLLVFI